MTEATVVVVQAGRIDVGSLRAFVDRLAFRTSVPGPGTTAVIADLEGAGSGLSAMTADMDMDG